MAAKVSSLIWGEKRALFLWSLIKKLSRQGLTVDQDVCLSTSTHLNLNRCEHGCQKLPTPLNLNLFSMGSLAPIFFKVPQFGPWTNFLTEHPSEVPAQWNFQLFWKEMRRRCNQSFKWNFSDEKHLEFWQKEVFIRPPVQTSFLKIFPPNQWKLNFLRFCRLKPADVTKAQDLSNYYFWYEENRKNILQCPDLLWKTWNTKQHRYIFPKSDAFSRSADFKREGK